MHKMARSWSINFTPHNCSNGDKRGTRHTTMLNTEIIKRT